MNRLSFYIPQFFLILAVSLFAQNKVTKTFTVNGTTHSCNWYVPSGISKPPVVFFIHGATGSGTEIEGSSKATPVAEKEKFIAVYPSASGNGGSGVWADMSGTTNFPFFLAVLDTLDRRYQIDRNRIYMTGFSQGGFISFVAGCKYSDIFAAIAPMSGHAGSECTLTRPVPVFLTFGGKEDKTAFVKDLNIWLKLNNCPSTPIITRPYSKVTRVSYGPCDEGTYVVMDSISGWGHKWPSATDLNQAEEIWAFFKKFSLQNSTDVHRQAPLVAHKPVSAIYTSGMIRLQGIKENVNVKIVDTKGRLVTSAIAKNQQIKFTNRPGGIFMLVVERKNNPVSIKVVIP